MRAYRPTGRRAHPIFASVLLNRYEVSKDGKTAYERLRGRKSTLLGLELEEILQWRRAVKGACSNKLDLVWEDDCFAGYRSQSGETKVSTSKGVFRTRIVRRVPGHMRWGRKIF